MVKKTLLSLVFLAFIVALGGFVVLSVWDIPVTKAVIEKPVDTSKVLDKKT